MIQYHIFQDAKLLHGMEFPYDDDWNIFIVLHKLQKMFFLEISFQ